MELTGKAREDFKKWYCKELIKISSHLILIFISKSNIEKNAHIIEFFDSVGIYIQTKRFCQGLEFKEWYYVISDTRGLHFNDCLKCRIKEDSRQEATEQAIIKANEIYNAKTS
ncbi:hypothetical protein [Empedobacter sp.]|uniref:hypothetical protein n=1 Tax=Empedobacter sp. TaxID=1927715 RepID=UPI0028A0BBC0|nr:hypothetical protein [Empedobacter sp.]